MCVLPSLGRASVCVCLAVCVCVYVYVKVTTKPKVKMRIGMAMDATTEMQMQRKIKMKLEKKLKAQPKKILSMIGFAPFLLGSVLFRYNFFFVCVCDFVCSYFRLEMQICGALNVVLGIHVDMQTHISLKMPKRRCRFQIASYALSRPTETERKEATKQASKKE